MVDLPATSTASIAEQAQKAIHEHDPNCPLRARRRVVSRWDDEQMTIVYLCRGEAGGWTADLEDERIWKFTDDLEAQLMLGYAAGYDETAAVVTFES